MASLTADPPACTVAAAGGTSTHQIANPGAERLVFKVKSSNNTDYLVKPVFGFAEPGAATALTITRKAGPPKEDKLVIQYAVVVSDSADATAAFNASTPAGTITTPLSAA